MGQRIHRSTVPWLVNVPINVDLRMWLAQCAVTNHANMRPAHACEEVYEDAHAYWKYLIGLLRFDS
jgi:hypothetical protein